MSSKPPDRWQNEAMRLGGEALVEKIFELADGQRELAEGQKEMLKMMDKFDDMHNEHTVGFAMLLKAFPGGDTDGHRRAHDAMIESIIVKNQLRAHLLEKGLGGLIWAGICGLGLIIYYGVITFIKLTLIK